MSKGDYLIGVDYFQGPRMTIALQLYVEAPDGTETPVNPGLDPSGVDGPLCPEPCLAVEVLTDLNVYNYGDTVVYRVLVTNNQDDVGHIAISYGYVDPTPKTHIIGTFVPDIYPGDTYVSLPADFKVSDEFYSGKYVFFATATDVHNPECTVSAAKQFWIGRGDMGRELTSLFEENMQISIIE